MAKLNSTSINGNLKINGNTITESLKVKGDLEFSGTLTGNVDADTIYVNTTSYDDETQTTTFIPYFLTDSSGNKSLYGDGSLKYNPVSNTLTAGTFSGSLSGNATSATTASNYASSGTIKTELDKKLNLTGGTLIGNIIYDYRSTSGIGIYNDGIGELNLLTFTDGVLKWSNKEVYHEGNKPTPEEIGAVSGGGGLIRGNLTMATDAGTETKIIFNNFNEVAVETLGLNTSSKLSIDNNEIYHAGNKQKTTYVDTTTYDDSGTTLTYIPYYLSDSTGDKTLYGDSNLSYNPTTNTLTTAIFNGIASNASKINVNITSSPTNYRLLMTSGSATGSQSVYVDSTAAGSSGSLYYNPSSNTLYAANISGNAAGSLKTTIDRKLNDYHFSITTQTAANLTRYLSEDLEGPIGKTIEGIITLSNDASDNSNTEVRVFGIEPGWLGSDMIITFKLELLDNYYWHGYLNWSRVVSISNNVNIDKTSSSYTKSVLLRIYHTSSNISQYFKLFDPASGNRSNVGYEISIRSY